MEPGLKRPAALVEVRLGEGLQIDLGAGTQLGHHLTSAERGELTTALQRFALGIGMQETTGIEVTGTRGDRERAQVEGLNGDR